MFLCFRFCARSRLVSFAHVMLHWSTTIIRHLHLKSLLLFVHGQHHISIEKRRTKTYSKESNQVSKLVDSILIMLKLSFAFLISRP